MNNLTKQNQTLSEMLDMVIDKPNSNEMQTKVSNDVVETTEPAEGCYLKNRITLQEADQLEQLLFQRYSMCGIGTKRVKNFLLRKAKEGDHTATVLYVALQVEDKRISSMTCSDWYRSKNYNEALSLLKNLIKLIDETGIGNYGYYNIPYSDYAFNSNDNIKLLCIDLPGGVQIGYVVPMIYGTKKGYGKAVSPGEGYHRNLCRIEQAIKKVYGKQILKKYGANPAETKVVLPNIIIDRHKDYAEVLEPKSKLNNAERQQVYSAPARDVIYYVV